DVVHRLPQPALVFDDAFQRGRLRARVEEATQATTVFAQASSQRVPIEAGIGHEPEAGERKPPMRARMELRTIVVVADRAAALRRRVDATQAEAQADEAERREDVEEHAEGRQSDPRGADQHEVARDEDGVEFPRRSAAEK